MRSYSIYLLATWLLGFSLPANALQAAPLQVLNAYIEGNARCSENLVEWNRKYNARAISGDVSRVFYYHVISFQEWGQCGQPYMKEIFSELQKSWLIFSRRHVSEAAAETKEAELIGLLFAAIRAGEQGNELVNRYIRQTTSKLMNLEPERQYFNCTYFGDQPACTD